MGIRPSAVRVRGGKRYASSRPDAMMVQMAIMRLYDRYSFRRAPPCIYDAPVLLRIIRFPTWPRAVLTSLGLAVRTTPGVTPGGILTSTLTRPLGAILALLGVIPCLLPAARALAAEPPAGKRILTVAPMQWDRDALTVQPNRRQTMTDFANLTGGVLFGMNPGDVNNVLPTQSQGISWSKLPPAREFSDDARYVWVRLDAARDLAAGIDHCAGESSYVALLFYARGLFRLSYRLIPDANCPSVSAAAADVFARYLAISPNLALSVHYRSGPVDVVDINDPTVSYLIPQRWHFTEQ